MTDMLATGYVNEQMEPLREWVASGKPIWGTCAGMILLADKITGKMKVREPVS